MAVVMVIVMMLLVIAATAIAIRVMVVSHFPVIAIPEALIIHPAFIARSTPLRTFVRWASPITLMPAIAVALWIPISVHPGITRTRGVRANPDHAGARRLADVNSHGKLG